MLFHEYLGENVGVTNCISQFYISVQIKDSVKLAHGNMGHVQGIWIILCHFTNCPNLYAVIPDFTGHPSVIISSGDLKCYFGFQNITSEPLEHCYFIEPQGCSWRSPYQTLKKWNLSK